MVQIVFFPSLSENNRPQITLVGKNKCYWKLFKTFRNLILAKHFFAI